MNRDIEVGDVFMFKPYDTRDEHWFYYVESIEGFLYTIVHTGSRNDYRVSRNQINDLYVGKLGNPLLRLVAGV